MTAELEERIRSRAYRLWQADGCPVGKADAHWEKAVRIESSLLFKFIHLVLPNTAWAISGLILLLVGWFEHDAILQSLASPAFVMISCTTLVALSIWLIPIMQTRRLGELDAEKRASTTNEYRKTIAQAATGLLAVVGFFLTYHQIQVTLQKDLSDRLAKAIDAVGSSSTALKVGGVYTLARIMRDSPGDSAPILQVLSAFVRGATPISNSPARVGAPPADVTAALLVISNRPAGGANAAPSSNIDLRNTDLHEATLENLNLNGAILINSSLEGADLTGANLVGADLSFTKLDGTVLRHADLRGANLLGASLRETVLNEADLTFAQNLTGEQLSRAIYDSAKLPSAIGQKDPRNGR